MFDGKSAGDDYKRNWERSAAMFIPQLFRHMSIVRGQSVPIMVRREA